MHCVGRCLKTDKSNKLTTVNFMSAVFTSRKKSIVVASQRWVLSHLMCFSSFCTDKQSFSCLMQVAIIEVSCCQPFFQEHCLESHPAILEQQTQINRNVWVQSYQHDANVEEKGEMKVILMSLHLKYHSARIRFLFETVFKREVLILNFFSLYFSKNLFFPPWFPPVSICCCFHLLFI